MRSMLAFVVLISMGCGAAPPGPPRLVVDRTACSHCGMLVSEEVYAAAFQAPGAEARIFDDIGCLLKALRKENASELRFWFHDALDGRWIEGDAATFVESPEIRTPMGGGILAHRDGVIARQKSHAQHGRTYGSLRELIAGRGDTE